MDDIAHSSYSGAPEPVEIGRIISRYLSKPKKPVILERSTALIPLQGIDVPFHSTYLRSGVPSYRNFLNQRIAEADIDADKLVGKWIPNVMGKPFSLSSEYIRDAYEITQSPILKELIENINGIIEVNN